MTTTEAQWRAGCYDDDVRGTIIGGDRRHYEFWTEERDEVRCIWPSRIAEGEFANDDEALAWFREHYPEHFAKGCEMRVWD